MREKQPNSKPGESHKEQIQCNEHKQASCEQYWHVNGLAQTLPKSLFIKVLPRKRSFLPFYKSDRSPVPTVPHDKKGSRLRKAASDVVRLWDQYMPPIPPPMPPPAGAAGVSSGMLTTSASVVRTVAATDAAFWRAERATLVGSTMPFSTMSQ